MQNKVEYNIPSGSTFTFKVKAGATVKIGQLVAISGNREVELGSATNTEKAVGVVYSGTVGVDGVNVGYQGSRGDVVTVVILRPFVYLEAGTGGFVAGDTLMQGANGTAVKLDTATKKFSEKVGLAITGATVGQRGIVALG